MKTKKTSEVSDTSFEDMRKGFSGTNQAANEAKAEVTKAPSSKKTGVAKRLAKRIDVDEPEVRTTAKRQSSIKTTVDNAQLFNAYLGTFVPAWGSNNVLIVLTSLVALHLRAAALVSDVLKALTLHTIVLDKRFALYDGLEALATRILNELKACGANAATIENAEHYVKKLRGKRIIAIDPDETNEKHISACQLSYGNQLQNLEGLILVVSNEVLYAPLEDELKPVDLVAYHEAMAEANAAVSESQAELDAVRRERNKCFNEPVVGLVDVYQTAKAAAKARYGVTSAEFKSIKGLGFNKIK